MNPILVTGLLTLIFSMAQATRPVRKAIPAAHIAKLIKDLESKDLRLRCVAAMNLDYTENPVEVKKHLATFLMLARSGDDCAKGAAIETISKLDSQSKEGLNIALSLLDEVNSDLHWRAANAIHVFVCSLKKSVQLADIKERYYKYKMKNEIGTRLLRAIACYGYESFPIIKEELRSSDRFIQAEAIQLSIALTRATSRVDEKKEILKVLRQLEPNQGNKDLLKSHLKVIENEIETIK